MKARRHFNRSRRGIDLSRLRIAASGPGADPRVWLTFARVLTEPEDIRFDAQFGWIVECEFVGGPLDGERPVVCRVGSQVVANGKWASQPLRNGEAVIVLITEGDANVEPVIVASLNDTERAPPSTVNGTEVTLDYLLKTHVLAVPGEDVDVEADNVRVNAAQVRLADPEPTQAFLRGTAFASALSSFLDSTGTFSQTVAAQFANLEVASVGPLTPLKAPFAAIGNAFAQWGGYDGSVLGSGVVAVPFDVSAAGTLKATLVDGDALSTRIKGE